MSPEQLRQHESTIRSTEHLNPDSPIESSSEDLLGFGPFSNAIAEGLIDRAPPSGFVVGLQARWGMGKSSAVNLCLEHIRALENGRADADRIVIKIFNPWFFSGVDALSTGYLEALGDAVETAVSPREKGRLKKAYRTIKAWRKKTSAHSEIIGSTTAGAVTLLSGGFAAPLSNALKGSIVNALKDKPTKDNLSKRFGELVSQLENVGGRVLIIVDDLDRLHPTDVNQVLSLVKTFGNLPGVTHLLVYDRQIVDSALREHQKSSPSFSLPSYREKIVQAEFDLPLATQEGLQALLSRGIEDLIKEEPDFDEMDWYYALQMALGIYLKSPRDVVKFTNSMRVIWPSVSGEVYFPDLFLIEIWRLFDREFYEIIRENKSVLTGVGQMATSDEERREACAKILEKIPESRRKSVSRVFSRIFPAANKHMDDQWFSDISSIEGRWRIGKSRGFDAFFRMSSPINEYSQKDRRRISGIIYDENAIDFELSAAMERRLNQGTFLPKFLEVLLELAEKPLSPSNHLLNVVARRGDEILDQAKSEPEMKWWIGRRRLTELARRCLLNIPTADRLDAIRISLREAGLSTRASLIANEFYPYDEAIPAQTRANFETGALSEAEARELATEFVVEFEKDPMQALSSVEGSQAIWLWDSIRGAAPIAQWIEANIDRADVIIFFIDMLMSHVSSTNGEYRELRSTTEWKFFDIALIAEVAGRLLAAGNIPPESEDLVRSYIRDVTRRNSSLQDDGEPTTDPE